MRGYDREERPFHADVLEQAVSSLVAAGYKQIRCVGGGHIRHTTSPKSIRIAGTSSGCGKADPLVTRDVCQGGKYDVQVVAELDFPKLFPDASTAVAGDATPRLGSAVKRFARSSTENAGGPCRQQ